MLQSTFCQHIVYAKIFYCESHLYTHLSRVCLSWERDPSSDALPMVYAYFFQPGLKVFRLFFFRIQNQASKDTES